MKRITLAELIIKEVGKGERGAITKTAQLFGVTPTDVCKWKAPRDKKGFGGDIPGRLKPKARRLKIAHGWDITEAEIIDGYREVA